MAFDRQCQLIRVHPATIIADTEVIPSAIIGFDDDGKYIGRKNTDSSDDARRAILKIYSYETPLYSAVNRANQCQDQMAISTLGPFSKLLFMTLFYPP